MLAMLLAAALVSLAIGIGVSINALRAIHEAECDIQCKRLELEALEHRIIADAKVKNLDKNAYTRGALRGISIVRSILEKRKM